MIENSQMVEHIISKRYSHQTLYLGPILVTTEEHLYGGHTFSGLVCSGHYF